MYLNPGHRIGRKPPNLCHRGRKHIYFFSMQRRVNQKKQSAILDDPNKATNVSNNYSMYLYVPIHNILSHCTGFCESAFENRF